MDLFILIFLKHITMDLVICGLGYMEGLQLLIGEVISFLARGLSATLLWARGASIFQKCQGYVD